MAERVRTKSGRVLTEADIERLADQAEAGFDLTKWKPRRGRPPLEPKTEMPAPRIAVRLPRSLYHRVMKRAGDEHRSVSAVVRDLLESYAGKR